MKDSVENSMEDSVDIEDMNDMEDMEDTEDMEDNNQHRRTRRTWTVRLTKSGWLRTPLP